MQTEANETARITFAKEWFKKKTNEEIKNPLAEIKSNLPSSESSLKIRFLSNLILIAINNPTMAIKRIVHGINPAKSPVIYFRQT